MTEEYTKAKFWKCALQVNLHSYIKYRGKEHGLTETEYNAQLLKICLEEKIKVIGIADHGNVSGVDAIRNVMTPEEILVFPGFEISSSERIHFVCLFPEDISTTELDRYLGNLDLLEPEQGILPSRLSAEQIFSKIEELGGFIYAAHCTEDRGLLKARMNHIWQNPSLKSAQIPGSIEDLKGIEDDFYRKALLNKNRDYKREIPIAVINAKDVEKPETLKDSRASCLIKMTNPSFEAFKQAFQDPDSRVRLNSEVFEEYYSRIESVKITGGYLDKTDIDFSEHLNTVIGGRGSGKSTLLESVRYALELEPAAVNAKKQHQEIIKENIGKSKGRIELVIRSSVMNGQTYTIARRYGESATVKDGKGEISSFLPSDILPGCEVYGQNEIYEIAQNQRAQKQLLGRFLGTEHNEYEEKIRATLNALVQNRFKLSKAIESRASVEDELNQLPKLQERLQQFRELGIEDKLKIIPHLETEKRLKRRIKDEELDKIEQAVVQINDALPDTEFLSDSRIKTLPHSDLLQKIRASLDSLKKEAQQILEKLKVSSEKYRAEIVQHITALEQGIRDEEDKLENTFKQLPSAEGKSGREVGTEYQRLLQTIETISPKKSALETWKAQVAELRNQRLSILDELSGYRAERTAKFELEIKKLNKNLKDKLKLTVKPEANRKPIIDFLLKCNLENVGLARLEWVENIDDFSPIKLVELIEKGPEELIRSGWSITPTVATALSKLSASRILELQEIELPDLIEIQLNIAHQGTPEYRPLERLSTGQQCTAILHLLLLQNRDPLIMDQPEDNLDNAFIADRIVMELRNAKLNRQFIFATHNANIPVFGDAEWIGVLTVEDGYGVISKENQGAVDAPKIKEHAATILEGGKTAFNQRKLKYGY